MAFNRNSKSIPLITLIHLKWAQTIGIKYILVFTVLIYFLINAPAQAHAPDQSYIFLDIDDQLISGRVELTVKDLNKALNLGWQEDNSITREMISSQSEMIDAYVLNNLGFSVNDQESDIAITERGTLKVSFAQFILIHFELNKTEIPPATVNVENNLLFDLDESHRSLLVVENNWKTGTYENDLVIALSFSPGSRTQVLDLTDGSMLNGLWGLIKLGMHHIWIGADHVLFLIALLIPSVMTRKNGRWIAVANLRSAVIGVVKIVTVFTIAHSITLSMATLDVFSLESRLVESVIALSIGAAALHILVPKVSSHALWLVLIFGLFHGFGFASVMSEMQIPQSFVFGSLLGFNVGVEIGQLAIVAVVVPLIYVMRRTNIYSHVIMPLVAIGLITISLYWFIERAFSFDFRVGSSLKALIGF